LKKPMKKYVVVGLGVQGLKRIKYLKKNNEKY